ncbi:MAG TPA: tripartite tricarboxylate transporter substrate-binding protein [Burkholderiales bacterium]|nr:tripartite tricarboxylate transporter substrate-binding protein [Burkholderiales bacterium]
MPSPSCFASASRSALAFASSTPVAVITRLDASLVRAIQEPDFLESIVSAGGDVGANSPQEFAAFIRAEHERWGKLIRESGIRLE